VDDTVLHDDRAFTDEARRLRIEHVAALQGQRRERMAGTRVERPESRLPVSDSILSSQKNNA